MRVGIDLRCLSADGSAGAGVAHAARFLTEALLELEVPWEWKIFSPLCKGELEGVIPLPNFSGSSLRAALRNNHCDLLFVPSGACAPGISIPQIPWVHDLAIFDHPEWFPESWLKRQITTRLFALGLRRAPIVFAVSDETKNQIIVHLGIDPNKIIVTHEGGDPELQKNDVGPRTTDVGRERFSLAIGTIEPRKNFEMLARIWPDVFKQTRCGLLIVGKRGWGNVLIKEEDEINIRSDMKENEKRQFLKAADLVLVPSLYEGFGIVALEAMQAGTALISSDRGALPEVIGDGGLLLSPYDESLWRQEIIRLLQDDAARKLIAQKGKERSRYFSWKNTASRIVEEMKNIRL